MAGIESPGSRGSDSLSLFGGCKAVSQVGGGTYQKSLKSAGGCRTLARGKILWTKKHSKEKQ